MSQPYLGQCLKTWPPLAKVIPKCLVLNARSLAKPDAASALCTEVITNKIDVCFISEPWLNSRILSSLICPDGFILVRKDRSDERLGGGVAILCRNDWKINKLDFNNTVFECLWCEFHINNYNKDIMSRQFITRRTQHIQNLIYLTICPKVVNRFCSRTPVLE